MEGHGEEIEVFTYEGIVVLKEVQKSAHLLNKTCFSWLLASQLTMAIHKLRPTWNSKNKMFNSATYKYIYFLKVYRKKYVSNNSTQ